nr:tyrosine-type recombinase/integrase [Mesorhizobium sp.]
MSPASCRRARRPTLKAALRFLALTCVRPGEVLGMTRNEFDLRKAVWYIPAERMKMRAPHDVPLSKQALRVLEEVWPLSEHGGLVFPSIRSTKRPLSENAMNATLRRLREHFKMDFRDTYATDLFVFAKPGGIPFRKGQLVWMPLYLPAQHGKSICWAEQPKGGFAP